MKLNIASGIRTMFLISWFFALDMPFTPEDESVRVRALIGPFSNERICSEARFELDAMYSAFGIPYQLSPCREKADG